MKFSIRDLFLVTLIVALAVGWWIARSPNSRPPLPAAGRGAGGEGLS